jgi:hypothetical protein
MLFELLLQSSAVTQTQRGTYLLSLSAKPNDQQNVARAALLLLLVHSSAAITTALLQGKPSPRHLLEQITFSKLKVLSCRRQA